MTDAPSLFLVEPRLDPKPWGGRRLEAYGCQLPPDLPVGEALLTAGEARVGGGPMAGHRLGDLAIADPDAVVGHRGLGVTDGRPLFPLLVKLIDAAENLSIQVHPDDDAARGQGRLGKTEAWHVLAAQSGSVLFLGLRPGVSVAEFAAACRHGGGEAARYLRSVPAIPGTTVLIPAGTVHALGAGVLVYEVQQPSDVTYRLDDWGRVDATGRPRELHLDAGLAVLKPALRPETIASVDNAQGAGRRLVAACRYFALEQLLLVTGEEATLAAPDTPQVVTCLWGEAEVAAAGATAALTTGSTAIIAAGTAAACVRALAPALLLRTWVPDLVAEVVEPARAAGATDRAIARLAGALPDLDEVLMPAGSA